MNDYLNVLNWVYYNHPTTKSDFARNEANILAEACSRGHITTVVCGIALNKWHITSKGLKFLEFHYGDLNK